MAGLRVTALQSRPMEFLDFTSGWCSTGGVLNNVEINLACKLTSLYVKRGKISTLRRHPHL
jgi:hypothetical protein